MNQKQILMIYIAKMDNIMSPFEQRRFLCDVEKLYKNDEEIQELCKLKFKELNIRENVENEQKQN